MLGEVNYEFIEAGNGREGLEVLNKDKAINLILCDYNMPEMDGAGFLDERNKIAEYQKVPFVMVTSARSETLIDQCNKKGVSGWLTKPFKKESLTEMVAGVLK
jgi:CheY-like chemotaxis protein